MFGDPTNGSLLHDCKIVRYCSHSSCSQLEFQPEQNEVELSDLALANVIALANDEDGSGTIVVVLIMEFV